jgi:hypothetical protein
MLSAGFWHFPSTISMNLHKCPVRYGLPTSQKRKLRARVVKSGVQCAKARRELPVGQTNI